MSNKITLEKYFKKAQKERWAISQFNFSDLKMLEAIVLAAKQMRSPIILGTSENESKSIGLKQAMALVRSFREEGGVPLFLNLDHGRSLGYIKKAINIGYDSVHFDGSGLTLAENIRETKKIKEYAKKFNVWVEGEVGVIGDAKNAKEVLTDPQEALTFIKATKIDSLAVAVGNLHGGQSSAQNPNLNLKRLSEIKEKVGKSPLVLHGGSGVPDKDIKDAIRLGIVKINIATELRATFTNALREALKKPEIVPYKYMPEVVQAVQKVVEEKIKLFGSKNKL